MSKSAAAERVLLSPVVDSRPAGRRWGNRVDGSQSDRQPSLLDALQELLEDASGPPRPRGVVVRPDGGPGAVSPAAGLPDPTAWAAVLGLAVGQALVGARPTSQLQSWLDPLVLADLRYEIRQRVRGRRGQPARATPSVGVVSVRTQCPTPTAVEATVHLRVGSDSRVLGARLDAYGSRWLCTALARPQPIPVRDARAVSELPPDRDTA